MSKPRQLSSRKTSNITETEAYANHYRERLMRGLEHAIGPPFEYEPTANYVLLRGTTMGGKKHSWPIELVTAEAIKSYGGRELEANGCVKWLIQVAEKTGDAAVMGAIISLVHLGLAGDRANHLLKIIKADADLRIAKDILVSVCKSIVDDQYTKNMAFTIAASRHAPKSLQRNGDLSFEGAVKYVKRIISDRQMYVDQIQNHEMFEMGEDKLVAKAEKLLSTK